MHLLIKDAFARTGKTKKGLANLLGLSNSAVTNIIAGKRAIKAEELPAIVKYFGLDLVPVVGRVLQGGWIERKDADSTVQVVYVDPFAAPMQAYEITGDGMMPRYDDGDAVVVWSEQKRKLISD